MSHRRFPLSPDDDSLDNNSNGYKSKSRVQAIARIADEEDKFRPFFLSPRVSFLVVLNCHDPSCLRKQFSPHLFWRLSVGSEGDEHTTSHTVQDLKEALDKQLLTNQDQVFMPF
ncbi:uncharacterized protein [Montipora capricornis]|uniref:uncharacterized protein isoform X3 n=1 Tax=Montipora capricornis TaxID=246305 RepID=UPI0035F1701C